MCKENDRKHERQVEEEFNLFIRLELLNTANEARLKQGLLLHATGR